MNRKLGAMAVQRWRMRCSIAAKPEPGLPAPGAEGGAVEGGGPAQAEIRVGRGRGQPCKRAEDEAKREKCRRAPVVSRASMWKAGGVVDCSRSPRRENAFSPRVARG